MILLAILALLGVSLALLVYRRSVYSHPNRMSEAEKHLSSQLAALVGNQHPIIASAVFCTSVHYCNIHKREMMGKMLIEIAAFATALATCNSGYRSKHGITEAAAQSIGATVIGQLSLQYREPKRAIEQAKARYCAVADDKERSLALLVERALVHRPARAAVDLNEAEDDFDGILTEAVEGMWEQLVG